VAEPDSSFPELINSATESANSSHYPSEPTAPSVPGRERQFKLWENDSFAFGDVVDILNPLQHLPIVATIYRKMTDDKIGFAPRIIGGALWGRVGGFVSGLINAASEWFTGKDIGDHLYAAVLGQHDNNAQSRVVSVPSTGTANHINERPAMLIEQAQSSFPGFNDDGGFSPERGVAEKFASSDIPPVVHAAAAIVNSYAHNSDLLESKEPFRLRFPA
jgi:hypothetical protein